MYKSALLALTLVLAAGAPLMALPKLAGALINPRREMLVKSDGKPARLNNNPRAKDHTLAEVLDFVAIDATNRTTYRLGSFVCTEYAIAVHDRAEAAGIRAALVSVGFEEGVGHALNAFNTTDYGLVYIDCTGSSRGDPDDRYDTVGYLKTGKAYGRLHIDLGARWPVGYERYEDAMSIFRDLDAWDEDLGREFADIQSASKELNARLAKINRRNGLELKRMAAALQARVTAYNQQLQTRNDLAKTFRLQFSENKSPVANIDLFW